MADYDAAAARDAIAGFMKRQGLNNNSWAQKAGVSEGTIRNFLKGSTRSMTRATYQKLAGGVGVAIEELMSLNPPADGAKLGEENKSTNLIAMPSSLSARESRDLSVTNVGRRRHTASGEPDIPILGNARGGDEGFFLDNGAPQGYYPRPFDLEGVDNGYAVRMIGDSMKPRIEHGWLCFIDPSKPPALEDDVLIELLDGQAFIKQLVRRTAKTIVCREYQPREREVAFQRDKIKNMHLVVSSTRVRA